MPRLSSLTLATAAACAALLLPSAPALAQDRTAVSTELSAQPHVKKKAAPARVAPRVAPRRVAPRTVAPRQVAPRTVAPRHVAPRTVAPRHVAPRTVTPRTVTPRTPQRAVGAPARAPRAVTFSGPRTVNAGRVRSLPARGVGRAVVRGQNFSAWRSGYRFRHGNRWRTFIALGALGAIAYGGATYYPYAYLSAPQPLCDGLTEDGCQMMWQEVETVEGDVVPQCVAYCPWQ
jgi:hypothetical protein